MKILPAALLAFVLLASTAFAEPLFITLPETVRIDVGDVENVPLKTNGKKVIWRVTKSSGVQILPQYGPMTTLPSSLLLIKTKIPGVYELEATTAAGDELAQAVCLVTVGNAPPPGPNPPGPTPPGPGPDPFNPPPIPGDGLRVLIVYESGDTLPVGQHSILYGKTVRDYLNATCPVGPDGKTREWRIYDKDVDTTGESKLWQDALKRPHPSIPWIVISNGKTGFEGPLPATVDATLELLKKYVAPTAKRKKPTTIKKVAATHRSQPYIFYGR